VAAAEYRLLVANLYATGFVHYLDGPIGQGQGELRLDRLEHDLDADHVPSAVLLYDRSLKSAWDDVAGVFKSVRTEGRLVRREHGRRWEEIVWEGVPGRRTVWLIAPLTTVQPEIKHLALEAGDGLRYWIPYRLAQRQKAVAAVAVPVEFLRVERPGGSVWTRYLQPALAFDHGLAVVVGVSDNPSFADFVYFVVENPPAPATFKVVIGWAPRGSQFEAPNGGRRRR
jgi:hypothetical protein